MMLFFVSTNFRSLLNTLNSNYDGIPLSTSNDWQSTKTYTNSFVWIGHATVLLNMDGENFLFDPIFSNRASPFTFIGPKRLMKPAIPINSLPKISKVLISHNHYDHLDINSLKALQEINQAIEFFVPKGDRELLVKHNLKNIKEFEWWETANSANKVIKFIPVKHWSARSFIDKNKSLWGGWQIKNKQYSIVHFGDTAYDERFLVNKEKIGNVDIGFIPIGSYAPRDIEKENHVNPQEAIQIAKDLNISYSYGIHWGTFFLSKEPLYEPAKLIDKYQDPFSGRIFSTTEPGKIIYLDSLKYQSIVR